MSSFGDFFSNFFTGDEQTRLAAPGFGSGKTPGWDLGGQFTDAGNWGIGSGDPSNPDRDALRGLGGMQQNYAQNLAGYGTASMGQYQNDRAATGATQDYLRNTMQGQNSVANEQLRQGMQQNLAAQQSMASSASPNDAAMASRNAAMNMGRINAGLAGQQALAGIQERNAAAGQLGQLQLGQSGQDLQAGLGQYGLANNAYGLSNNAYGTAVQNPQKTFGSMMGGGLGGGAGAIIGALL